MLVKEFSAKSEKEAIQIALDELNLKEEQVRIEVVDKGKRNLLGIGEHIPAVIRVYYDEISTLISNIQNVVEDILSKMNVDAQVEAYEESQNKIYVNIMAEDDAAILIGRKGSTLDALQFIISLITLKMLGDESDYHVLVDVAGYRHKREEALRELALQTASQVKRYKKPKILEPMNPYERRIVHMTLQDDNEVETKSDGEGTYKKVRVYLVGRGSYNNQRQNNYGRYNNSDYRRNS